MTWSISLCLTLQGMLLELFAMAIINSALLEWIHVEGWYADDDFCMVGIGFTWFLPEEGESEQQQATDTAFLRDFDPCWIHSGLLNMNHTL